MTNDELEKKILEIFEKAIGDWYEKDDGLFAEGYTPEEGDNRLKAFMADALIAAGMVDKSDYASMKETAVRYKAEVSKAKGRAKEAEHRAARAERAGRIIQRDMARVFDISNPRVCELIANIWDLAKKQAEKELAEEGKDES